MNTGGIDTDLSSVRNPINEIIHILTINKGDLIEKLLNLLKALKDRIGVLSHNMFTQSAERIKIYTNLYTVIFIYLKQKNVQQTFGKDRNGNDIKSAIKLEDVAENLLTNNGLLGRLENSSLGFFLGPVVPNLIRNEKTWGRKQIEIDGKTLKGIGGKSNKNKNKNIKKAKTKRRRS